MFIKVSKTGGTVNQTLKNYVRVIGALVLREARVRHGRTRLGYLWALIEPVFYVAVLSLLFSSFRSRAPHGESFALFFATGILPFQFYRNLANHVGGGFHANRPLFSYPLVKPIDAAISRTVLEIATSVVAICALFGVLVILLDVPLPHNLPNLFLAYSLMALYGFGTGLTNAVIRRKYPSWAQLFQLWMGPAFFLSGIFYSMQQVPSYYRYILSWNPLIHGVEGFRAGYYANYRTADLDLMYLFWFGISVTFFGLISERVTRKLDP